MSDTAWQVGSALAVIGASVGFILGRVTSGAKGWRADVENLQRLYDASVERTLKLVVERRDLGRQIAAYRAAEQKRQAQRKAAAKRAGEVSHAKRLAREAQEAATKAKTHAELIGLVGDAFQARAATPDGAEPVKLSPASLASTIAGEAA